MDFGAQRCKVRSAVRDHRLRIAACVVARGNDDVIGISVWRWSDGLHSRNRAFEETRKAILGEKGGRVPLIMKRVVVKLFCETLLRDEREDEGKQVFDRELKAFCGHQGSRDLDAGVFRGAEKVIGEF